MSKKQSYPGKYRAQAIRSVFAIIFFIAVYLLLLVFSLALVAFLFYSSVVVLRSAPGQRSIIIFLFLFFAIDVIALTLLVFIFTFFFRKQTVDRSGWIEVNSENQPKLFELIETISKRLETNFPQKVYLGSGVDAMVFYDSNFKNLFFPSKENLMIGLGLVNAMTDCELKTIIAHEFGHFTQRSLNVYSYVYIENQIIYKMLMDEDFYQNLILSFSKGKIYWVVLYYSKIIRWILRKAYHVVLKSFMALSREMEFHADELSASIGGTATAVTALLRLQLAGDSFHSVWQFYSQRLSENLKTLNIYPQHKFVMKKIAENHNMEMINDLPQVTKDIFSWFNRSKLVIENQWASHPSIIDRVNRLEELNIESNASYESAWNYFVNPEELQKEITEKLFRNWQFAEAPTDLSHSEFEEKYLGEIDKHSYDKRYSYFYEYRNISRFDLKAVLEDNEMSDFQKFEEIYTDEKLNLIYQFTGLTVDLRDIDNIAKGEFKIDIFEYDGKKYKAKESSELCDKLKKDHEKMYQKIIALDKRIFKFFYSIAESSGKEKKLINFYETYFYLVDDDKQNLKVYLDLIDAIQFIYFVNTFNQIESKMIAMREKENIFIERIRKILSDQNYVGLISDTQREKFQKYIDQKLIYFENQKYNSEALKTLQETIFEFYEVCSKAPFYGLKKLLDFQIEVFDANKAD